MGRSWPGHLTGIHPNYDRAVAAGGPSFKALIDAVYCVLEPYSGRLADLNEFDGDVAAWFIRFVNPDTPDSGELASDGPMGRIMNVCPHQVQVEVADDTGIYIEISMTNCKHCGEKYGDHTPGTLKCLFESTTYCEREVESDGTDLGYVRGPRRAYGRR